MKPTSSMESAVFKGQGQQLVFWSKDRRFGLRVDKDQLQSLISLCIHAKRNETGGVLIGHYNDSLNCGIVTLVTSPDEDSRAGAWWFERGTRHLRSLLARYWRSGKGYYLGEWHFHPHSAPTPSGTDSASMRSIATDPACNCRQPILLIIGGTPPTQWSISAHVYPAQEKAVPLFLETEEVSGALV